MIDAGIALPPAGVVPTVGTQPIAITITPISIEQHTERVVRCHRTTVNGIVGRL